MSDADTAARARQRRRSGWIFLRDVLVIVLIAVVVSFMIKTFVVRSFYIPSGSMENTLEVRDRILVDELTPNFTDYQRGDVVVFRDPGGWLPPVTTPERAPIIEAVDWVLSVVGLSAPDSDEHLVKRIIGLPGDTVACCTDTGQITVNGVAIDESDYVVVPTPGSPASSVDFEVEVPDNRYWVLGDNRYRSKDSRYAVDLPGDGFVPRENVVGRVFLVMWPFTRFGAVDAHHDTFIGVVDPVDEPDEGVGDEGEPAP